MSLAFPFIAAAILLSAAVGLMLRNLVRAALLLVVAWLGIAVFFLWAGAEFVAFAQALVYAGALSMVVLFAVLLTGRRGAADPDPRRKYERRSAATSAVLCAGAVFAVLAAAISRSPQGGAAAPPPAGARELGRLLAGPDAVALLAAGALLTAALIGAIAIAASDPEEPSP